ncbi:MAG: sel1 repeat family protein [Lentisphaeria bacterium]|nr:sel1 repeat family protein [Lentisphaeria bacterium]
MSIQIKNLLNWNNRTARAMNLTPFWMELVRTFGTELLYFLIDKEYANQIPESTAALKKFKTQITEWNGRKPKHGSVWILFAFKENLANLPAPFRKDGILLPFEWRTGEEVTQHSSLLPLGLIELADKVKQQFGKKAEKYYLYPDSIFQDRVDFSMDGVGFSSGWGALVSGLYLALNPKAMLLEWPFSSIQFDFEKGEMDAVGHLEEKITLAASFNAAELAVAPCQYNDANEVLLKLKKKLSQNQSLQRMKIFFLQDNDSVPELAKNLVICNQKFLPSKRNVFLTTFFIILANAVFFFLFQSKSWSRTDKVFNVIWLNWGALFAGIVGIWGFSLFKHKSIAEIIESFGGWKNINKYILGFDLFFIFCGTHFFIQRDFSLDIEIDILFITMSIWGFFMFNYFYLLFFAKVNRQQAEDTIANAIKNFLYYIFVVPFKLDQKKFFCIVGKIFAWGAILLVIFSFGTVIFANILNDFYSSRARKAFDRGEYTEAFKVLNEIDVLSKDQQYMLGWMYENGKGVHRNEVKAWRLYRKSGVTTGWIKKTKYGPKTYTYPANELAKQALRRMYIEGRGYPDDGKDFEQADWCIEAAEAGNLDIIYQFGLAYEKKQVPDYANRLNIQKFMEDKDSHMPQNNIDTAKLLMNYAAKHGYKPAAEWLKNHY